MGQNQYTLYRIWYEDSIVYVGRTKQPLARRLRGHVFGAPMHRKIQIEQVSRIEYAKLKTASDLNLYEIYYILKLKPALNRDDKEPDELTISLPELNWEEFTTPLWDKWLEKINEETSRVSEKKQEYQDIPNILSSLRSEFRDGKMSKEEYFDKRESLQERQKLLRKELYG